VLKLTTQLVEFGYISQPQMIKDLIKPVISITNGLADVESEEKKKARFEERKQVSASSLATMSASSILPFNAKALFQLPFSIGGKEVR
jgi:hypothetical protein